MKIAFNKQCQSDNLIEVGLKQNIKINNYPHYETVLLITNNEYFNKLRKTFKFNAFFYKSI